MPGPQFRPPLRITVPTVRSAYSCSMMMEAAGSSETLVTICRTTLQGEPHISQNRFCRRLSVHAVLTYASVCAKSAEGSLSCCYGNRDCEVNAVTCCKFTKSEYESSCSKLFAGQMARADLTSLCSRSYINLCIVFFGFV
jgi:hypothetical protein